MRFKGGIAMPFVREQFDADRFQHPQITEYPADLERFTIPCAVCRRPLYVDEETKNSIERAIEHDLDNGLTCPDCEQDYDRLAFE
jgi:hypothetical protein